MYQHPILPEIVREVLVTHRKSLFLTCQDTFKIEQDGEISMQLPIPVVALAATAVHLYFITLLTLTNMTFIQVAAALLDYKRGRDADFLAGLNVDTYDVHRGILELFQKEKPLLFQMTMEKMYKDAL
jgi:hypothetical protein